MIQYKTGTDIINWDSLIDLYFTTDGVRGFGKIKDMNTIKESFLNTYLVASAWDGDKIIGAVRMISDGLCYGWIHDMAVHPDYRKQGIAEELMKILQSGNEGLLFGLTSSFEAEGFYKKIGFKKHKTAYAKYPGDSMYLED